MNQGEVTLEWGGLLHDSCSCDLDPLSHSLGTPGENMWVAKDAQLHKGLGTWNTFIPVPREVLRMPGHHQGLGTWNTFIPVLRESTVLLTPAS